MQKKEHLLIVIMEECSSLISDYLDGNDLSLEMIDLYGSIELFKEEFSDKDIVFMKEKEIYSVEEFIKMLLVTQKIISKSLRVGLEEISIENESLKNIDLLFSCFNLIESFILKTKFSKFDLWKRQRKEKIIFYLEHSFAIGRLHSF